MILSPIQCFQDPTLKWLYVPQSLEPLLHLPESVTTICWRVKTLPYTFFSSEPEKYFVPKLSRSCILRGWSPASNSQHMTIMWAVDWPAPSSLWLLLQNCANALETAGQQQLPDSHRQGRGFSGLLERPGSVLLALRCVYNNTFLCFHPGHPATPVVLVLFQVNP